MRSPFRSTLALLAVASIVIAHETPVLLPPPDSEAEAWNVLRLAGDNVDVALAANLPRDAAAQLANIAGVLPALRSSAARSAVIDRLSADTIEVLKAIDTDGSREKAKVAWDAWKQTRSKLKKEFSAETVHAEIYVCPMHPLERHLKADDLCDRCGMSLVRRRLPASAVYQKPGEPTLKMTLRGPPLHVGQRTEVTVRFAQADGKPVTLDDLAEAHTKKIHLLINDGSLSDYHHEHPLPTNVVGEYAFAFTPQKPGPYRIWADVVPALSQVQEYDIADLPADAPAEKIADRQTSLSATVDGRRFDLAFATNGKPIRAGESIVGTVAVTEADGRGCMVLEPVMGTFAHLVGFHEDGRSVLHIHPYAKPPTGAADRGGPAFAFKFYAPTPGLIRFYCQVQIGGQQVFAPFTLNVAPADTTDLPTTAPKSQPATKFR